MIGPLKVAKSGWFLALLAAWFLLLVMPGLGFQPLRIDETVQVGLTELPVQEMLRQLPRNDPHPPGFHLLLKTWTTVAGISPFAARVPSVVFGLLAIWAIFLLGRRLGGERTGLLAAGLLSGSLFFLHYAQTARMYTLLLALTTFSLASLLAYIQEGRPRDLLAYALNGMVLVWVHYLGLLELSVEWLLMLVVALRTPHLPVRRRWLGLTGALLLAVLPLLLLWMHPMLDAPSRRFPFLVPSNDLGEIFATMWQTLLMLHTGPAFKGYVGPWFGVYAVSCLGLFGAGVAGVFFWRREQKNTGTLLLAYILLVLYAVLAMLIRVNSFYQIRYFLSALGPYLALVAFGLDTLWRKAEKAHHLPRFIQATALGFIGLLAAALIAPPATLRALVLWRRQEEVPYRLAAQTLQRFDINRVIYTGLERTPMGFVAPHLPALWANDKEQLALALQGAGRRAVVVYPDIADRETADRQGFTPWLRPWLRSLGAKEILLPGSQSPLALYLFNQPVGYHGIALKAQKTVLPMGGDYACRARGTVFYHSAPGASVFAPPRPCFLLRNDRPRLPHAQTDPTRFRNHYFNHYLHWTGFAMGPWVRHHRQNELRFWPLDRLFPPDYAKGHESLVSVLPPRATGEWPALTLGHHTRVAYSLYFPKPGPVNFFWRLNFPTHALLSVTLNGQAQEVRLSHELRDTTFEIPRAGMALLEIENLTAAAVELQGIQITPLAEESRTE